MTPALLALTRQYQQALASTAARTASAVQRSYLATLPLDDASAALWTQQATSLVEVGRMASADLTSTYLRMYGEIEKSSLAIEAGSSLPLEYRDGLDPEYVYKRSIIKARTLISQGMESYAAQTVAADGAASRADTDSMMAARSRSNNIYSLTPTIVGYRRVPDTNACQFCLLVSTQRYHTGYLMPIHTKCHCTTAPIIGKKDPGQVVDKELLQTIKESGAKARVATVREIGPAVLAVAA